MSDTQQYVLSLSRWHKVAERARKLVATLDEECRETLGRNGVSVVSAKQDLAYLASAAERVDQYFDTRGRLLMAWQAIRAALAKANAEGQVSETLGRIEALKSQAEKARALSRTFGVRYLDDVEEVVAARQRLLDRLGQLAPDKEVIRQMDALASEVIDTVPVTRAWCEAYAERARRLEQEVVKLNDSLSDLNATRVPVALERETAEMLGLA